MADTKRLRKKITESGITITALAQKCGMTRETLYNKLQSGDFKVSEMLSLSSVLHLKTQDRDAIFFD